MSDDFDLFLKAEDEGRGPYVTTVTGRNVHVMTPSTDEIHLVDIAHSLGHIARFNGHTRHVRAYSVAEHSLLVLRLARRRLQSNLAPEVRAYRGVFTFDGLPLFMQVRHGLATALLHDAHEAYLGDIVMPVIAAIAQRCCACAGFARNPIQEMKATLQRAIHQALGLPWPVPHAWDKFIHACDMEALDQERRRLLENDHHEPMPAAEATGAFLSEAVNLLDLDVRYLDGWRLFDVRA
jgi:hypothetical protein